jgi:hypothetical protein
MPPLANGLLIRGNGRSRNLAEGRKWVEITSLTNGRFGAAKIPLAAFRR